MTNVTVKYSEETMVFFCQLDIHLKKMNRLFFKLGTKINWIWFADINVKGKK